MLHALLLTLSATTLDPTPLEAHWPSWRGPLGTGVAEGAAPTSWSEEENIEWRVDVPGRGFSTPIVWGERIFLTTAVPTGAPAEPAPREEGGRNRRRGRGFGAAPVEQEFLVLALDRATGEELWRHQAAVATPHEGYHRQYGSYASASPVTDGEKLIASFGSFGLYALDLEGELLWSFDPEVELSMRNQFGEGANPVLYGDVVIHGYDHEGDSFALALNAETGKELWRVERDEPSVWSMPLVVEHEQGARAIFSGSNAVRAYALEDGELIWECGGLGLNAIPALQRDGDLLLAMSGYRGANLMALRLGGEGDLSDSEAVVWQSARGCAYTASPVLHEGKYYVVQDGGKISCFDAQTGEPYYLEERLPRGSTLKASPIAAGGYLYVATEEGDVHVIELGEEYEVSATNHLEGHFYVSSPAVAEGRLLLRGPSELVCVGE